MIVGNGQEGAGIMIVANGTDRSIAFNISNVNVEHVGGVGLDFIGNVSGTVFNSWMHGNAQGGARFANSAGGGTADGLSWVGGGFRKNGVAGLILADGARDMTVQGAYFVDNYGPGIQASAGITRVEQTGFENNAGYGALVGGSATFVADTFSTYGPQTTAIGGSLNGGTIALIGTGNEYYGGGSDPTVLANVTGSGTLSIAGGGKVLVGSGITVTGGSALETIPTDPPVDTTAPDHRLDRGLGRGRRVRQRHPECGQDGDPDGYLQRGRHRRRRDARAGAERRRHGHLHWRLGQHHAHLQPHRPGRTERCRPRCHVACPERRHDQGRRRQRRQPCRRRGPQSRRNVEDRHHGPLGRLHRHVGHLNHCRQRHRWGGCDRDLHRRHERGGGYHGQPEPGPERRWYGDLHQRFGQYLVDLQPRRAGRTERGRSDRDWNGSQRRDHRRRRWQRREPRRRSELQSDGYVEGRHGDHAATLTILPTAITGMATANNAVTLTGTSSPGSQISLYDGSKLMGSAVTSANGGWSYSGKAGANATHTYDIISTDLNGKQTKGTGLGLLGSNGADTLTGSGGNDIIAGGAGNDALTGGAGADTFAFTAAPNATKNLDRITDFASGTDKLSLARSVFSALSPGDLSTAAFVQAIAAVTADQHVIYNQATGIVSYDADGSGAGAAIAVVRLTPGQALTAQDIKVV